MNKRSKYVGHSSFFVRNGRQYSNRNYQNFKTKALSAEKYFQGKSPAQRLEVGILRFFYETK